ncbi:DUF3244 domain-containing protein [Arundinibacter roseus]|uniref:Secretion system C-terminal sorting domain-containing protein n=1 Tax=Arundinibacter roseus TaxID=2070510 RepID=A0A4R4KHV1_9BACT|nr:T9SS type A sorting domain-containing protein [Arundinibacter roseus]TDB67383.1 hypothetical protein EZE20_05390 [Arundinibacter roseus]
MKTNLKFILVAFTLATTVAFAGPGEESKKATSFSTGIYTSVDGRLNVNIEKSKLAAATVLILNSNGDILARESIGKKQSEASIKFDLSQLQEGEYKLAIVSNSEKEVKDFVITSEKEITKRTLTFE